MRNLRLAAALLFAITGCVADEGGGRPDDRVEDWRDGGKGDGQTCDFDGMTAATYYKQFAYEKLTSPTSDSVWYRIGMTWDLKAVLDNGNKVDLNVYFLPNDRIIAEYSEQKDLGEGRSEVLNQTVLVTRARIDDTTRAITIEGLGSGTPITIRNTRGCAPGITFKFSSNPRSPGLEGDVANIQSGLTSAYVIDPDHLEDVPSEAARRYFEEDVASGKIKIVRI